ncbi:unnamed protein product [Gordionus sp. m RMFG-2023]
MFIDKLYLKIFAVLTLNSNSSTTTFILDGCLYTITKTKLQEVQSKPRHQTSIHYNKYKPTTKRLRSTIPDCWYCGKQHYVTKCRTLPNAPWNKKENKSEATTSHDINMKN